MWLPILEIGAAQLRSVTEIEPKSPFLCVNRSSIRYGFRAGAKAIWYCVNIGEKAIILVFFFVLRANNSLFSADGSLALEK